MNNTLRCAVVGAMRGQSFIHGAQQFGRDIELVAICDTNPTALESWRDNPNIRCYRDYDELLSNPDIDAVCIATPVPIHARQAIAALNAGKHVLSEVTAAYTLEDAWALVEAVERTGLTYMMAENYCYMNDVLMVQNMVEQGVFGELVFASGSYLHDCRELFFTPEGDLTWRGEVRRQPMGNSYPTHSLGPVCRWLGINRTDYLKTTATWHSRGGAMPHYSQKNWTSRPEYNQPGFWQHPDTVTTMIRTQSEALIEIRVDWASARPHHMTRYELQGTKAAFTSSADPHQEPLIWIEGRSDASPRGVAGEWEPLSKYAEEFKHPLWKEYEEHALKAGHGGGDYFTLLEFSRAIRENRAPMIDVYDAVTWSSLTPLSQMSIEQGNVPVEVPRFKRGGGVSR